MSPIIKRRLFFIPNLICYFRFFLIIISIFLYQSHPIFSILLVFLSSLLDIFDGYLARKLKQESRFGQVLDFVIDRMTVIVMYFALTFKYSNLSALFIILLILENSSHFFYIYSTIFLKSRTHKEIAINAPYLLRKYYESKIFMAIIIIGHDSFFCFFYLHGFYSNAIIFNLGLLVIPFFILKNIIHLLQIFDSFKICLNTE